MNVKGLEKWAVHVDLDSGRIYVLLDFSEGGFTEWNLFFGYPTIGSKTNSRFVAVDFVGAIGSSGRVMVSDVAANVISTNSG